MHLILFSSNPETEQSPTGGGLIISAFTTASSPGCTGIIVEFLRCSGMIHLPSASYSPILGGFGGSSFGLNQGRPHQPEEEQYGAGVEV